MPIKGWTDAVRVPRLGQIALGYKDEKGAPRSVDYFVVPPEVQEVYGPQPRELDVLIPGEDLDKVFPAWLKRYGDQFGLICRGDGETATLSAVYARRFGQEYGIVAKKLAAAAGAEGVEGWQYVFSATGEIVPVEVGGDGTGWLRIPCAYKDCPHYRAKKCTEVALLSVLLPKVPGVLGVYQLDTGSFHSYQNIVNSLEILRRVVGRISFIPLKLKVRMETHHPLVVHNGQEKRVKSQNPVLYIDMGGLTLEKVLQLAREGRLLQVASVPAAAPLEIEPPDEDRKPELLYPPQEPEAVPVAPAALPDISAAVAEAQEEAPEPEVEAPKVQSDAQAGVGEPPEKESGPAAPEEQPEEQAQDLVFEVTANPRKHNDSRGETYWVQCKKIAGKLPDGSYVVYAAFKTPAVEFIKGLSLADQFLVPPDKIKQIKGNRVVVTDAAVYLGEDFDVPLETLGEDLEGLEGEAF